MRFATKHRDKNTPGLEATKERLDLWHAAFLGFGMLLMAAVGLWGPFRGHRAGSGPPTAAADQAEVWGQLECLPIDLERPDESVPTPGAAAQPIQWFFDRTPAAQVEALFKINSVTAEQQSRLLDKSRWQAAGSGWIITVPPEVVWDLSEAARKTIYAVLHQDPRNIFHQYPFRFSAERLEAWLDDCGLPEDKQTLLRKLMYPNGDWVYFSDAQLIESVCSLSERMALGKTLSRVPALLVRLRVTPASNLDSLVDYWGRGGRGKLMRPLLEGLIRSPDGGEIAVTNFFPTFARTRLYTYPKPPTSEAARREDCMWTSMNFFNETADNRFYTPAYTQKVLEEDYVRVEGERMFGDLIVLLDDQQNSMHMCVQVADDIIFTKNGNSHMMPWTLMRYADMIAYFPSDKPIASVAFRRKSPVPPKP